jgi:hypothetical protein
MLWKWELGDVVVPKGLLVETRAVAKARGSTPYYSPGRVLLRITYEGLTDEGKVLVEHQYRIRLGPELRDYTEQELVSFSELVDLWMQLRSEEEKS